jgi:DGQHR domain-containing protein
MKNTTSIQAFGYTFKQNSQQYLSSILSFDFIDKHSEVLIYGKHPQGYQREPSAAHYNKIKNYILKEKDFILPTSIILAVDESDLDSLAIEDKYVLEIQPRTLKGDKKIFRIVDGQHRVLAMREACKQKSELRNFCFHAVILVTKPNRRSVEMEVFYNINSKGKRLRVDLIELARFNYRILEKSLNTKELNEHISIQVAYHLNERIPGSVWNNAIKFGIHEEEVIGIIGVNAFRESIAGIVDVFIKSHQTEISRHTGAGLIDFSRKCSHQIAEFIHAAWDNIVRKKWPHCFKEGESELDSFFESKQVFYHKEFYIQRTLGAKSINGILSLVASEFSDLSRNALKAFEHKIKESRISGDDWTLGGTFAGYSSESGFKKVGQMILNSLKVSRTFK